jgi:hypothetical protein
MDQGGRVWFGVGFLALTLGNALGAVHMFRGNVAFVMVGVVLMFGGYQTMHYGAHDHGMVSLSVDESENPSQTVVRTWVEPTVLLVVATYCIAQGFVIGAQAAITSFTMFDMGATGAFIVGGYMLGHIAIHGVPL